MVKLTEKENGQTVIYFGVGDMPMNTFEEFENICKREFGGCRWMFIKTLLEAKKCLDTVEASYDNSFDAIYKDVLELRTRIENLEQNTVEPELPKKGLGSQM